MDNNSDNDSFGTFLSEKKRTQIVYSLNKSFTTIILGMKKITILVDNMLLRQENVCKENKLLLQTYDSIC